MAKDSKGTRSRNFAPHGGEVVASKEERKRVNRNRIGEGRSIVEVGAERNRHR